VSRALWRSASCLPVEDDVDRHPFAAQADGDRCGKFLVILDDEHTHLVFPVVAVKDASPAVTRR
jgi:hypothetical protein